MPKIIVTCVPRSQHPGFGAAGIYFVGGQPMELDATSEQLAELTSEPAVSFLKVEMAIEPAPVDPPKGKGK